MIFHEVPITILCLVALFGEDLVKQVSINYALRFSRKFTSWSDTVYLSILINMKIEMICEHFLVIHASGQEHVLLQ